MLDHLLMELNLIHHTNGSVFVIVYKLYVLIGNDVLTLYSCFFSFATTKFLNRDLLLHLPLIKSSKAGEHLFKNFLSVNHCACSFFHSYLYCSLLLFIRRTEAMQLMKEGGKWELYIPSELGYGDRYVPVKHIFRNNDHASESNKKALYHQYYSNFIKY